MLTDNSSRKVLNTYTQSPPELSLGGLEVTDTLGVAVV